MQAGSNGPPSSKKTVRPFYKTVAAQVEKNRRDKNLRSRLQREKVLEQSRNERRDDLLDRAMKGPRTKAPGTSAVPKVHRNKKSMSAFLNFMRPISSAFGAELISPSLSFNVPRRGQGRYTPYLAVHVSASLPHIAHVNLANVCCYSRFLEK